MKKETEDDPNGELSDAIAGATLATFGAAVVSIPWYGFWPLIVVSTTYLGVCVVARVYGSDDEGSK